MMIMMIYMTSCVFFFVILGGGLEKKERKKRGIWEFPFACSLPVCLCPRVRTFVLLDVFWLTRLSDLIMLPIGGLISIQAGL